MNLSNRLRFLATMSSQSPVYRAGRNQWRRGFSTNRGRGQFVSGDSHFQSVHDSNIGCRQGNSANQTEFRPPQSYNRMPPPSFYPNQQFRPPPPPYNQNQQTRPPPPSYNQNQQQFRPPPSYNQNQQFRQPPPYNQNQQFRQPPPYNRNQQFRQPPPPFNQNQAARPRPSKPLDYRNWEYAKASPPPDCERFVILSYNVLADYLAIGHRSKLYFHIPHYILDWQWRKKSIMFELGLWSADIMCLQEVDRFQDFEEELKLRGYSGIWKMRTGNAVDGCAIFWRTSRFKLLYEDSIQFNKLGLRDNVAQICVLESLSPIRTEKTALPPTSSAHPNKVVICNIHVLYNPRRGEIKLGQVRTLLDKAHAVSKIWNDAPVVLCGDFNCTPKSPLYNFISEQKLDLSGVDRDKVSGQASAEICAPNPYNPNQRPQFGDRSIRAPSLLGSGEIGIKPRDTHSDMQKDIKDDNAEISLFVNNSSLSHCTNTSLGVSDKARSNMQCGKENSALEDEVTKETQQVVLKGSKDETGSTFFVPIDSSKESSICLPSEGRFPTDQDEVDDEIHKFSPPADTHPEDNFDVTEVGHGEEANGSSHSNHESFSENSESNINIHERRMNSNDSTLPLVGNDRSSRAECNPEFMNASISEISTDLSLLTCSSDDIEVSQGSLGSFTSHSSADDKTDSCLTSYQETDKLEHLSPIKVDKPTVEGEMIDEDDNTFVSALHNTKDTFPPSLDSEANYWRTTYDPSSWTPMEIETATSNADCTLLEHPLQLRSTYAEVEDCSGTRDSNGEPLVTSYNRCFMGTVDYIWRSKGLQTVRALAPIPKQAMQWTPGFPTKKWGSDHIALASEVAFTKE